MSTPARDYGPPVSATAPISPDRLVTGRRPFPGDGAGRAGGRFRVTELGASTPPLLVLFLCYVWSFLPCRLVEIDRVFVLAPPRNLFSGPLILPICLRSEVSPHRRARVSAGGGRAGFGRRPRWARRFRPLHKGPVRTHLPLGCPVRPLLVGGGAPWELVRSALGATLPCGLWGFAGLCSVCCGSRGDVFSLDQIRLWIQGVGV